MKRTPTTLFLAYAIVLSSIGPAARAQSTLNTDEKTGSRSDIVYADVLNVEGRGMSKKKKAFIAVGVGAAVFAAMLAYALTHFWDD